MPLSDLLRKFLAAHFQVDLALVTLDGEDVAVNGTLLGDLGIGLLQPLLDKQTIIAQDDFAATLANGSERTWIRRVVLRDHGEQGIIEVIPNKAFLFLGDFGDAPANLSTCSSFLLAVACLPPPS